MPYYMESSIHPLSCERAMEQDPGFLAAVQEAKAGAAEGGVPIGACLVSKDGKILGQGHNMRVQKGSATLHVCSPETYTCVVWPDKIPTARRRFRL